MKSLCVSSLLFFRLWYCPVDAEEPEHRRSRYSKTSEHTIGWCHTNPFSALNSLGGRIVQSVCRYSIRPRVAEGDCSKSTVGGGNQALAFTSTELHWFQLDLISAWHDLHEIIQRTLWSLLSSSGSAGVSLSLETRGQTLCSVSLGPPAGVDVCVAPESSSRLNRTEHKRLQSIKSSTQALKWAETTAQIHMNVEISFDIHLFYVSFHPCSVWFADGEVLHIYKILKWRECFIERMCFTGCVKL